MISNPLINSLILIIICVPGLLANCISCFVISRHGTFKNAFGKLTAFHTLSNSILVFIFLFWPVPIALFNLDSSKFMQTNRRIGQLTVFFTECSYHTCFFISLNRLLAIGFPTHSRIIFNNIRTNLTIIFTIVLVGLYTCVYFIPGCVFFYDSKTSIWLFESSDCGVLLAKFDLMYNVGLFIIICTLDAITLILLRGANKRIQASMKTFSVDEIQKRQRREILFFAQALLGTVVYVLMILSFHVLSVHLENVFYIYLATTVTWSAAHSSGGFIVFFFNVEIRRESANWLCNRMENRKTQWPQTTPVMVSAL